MFLKEYTMSEISELDMFIGKRIRFFRKKRGWGLKLLASKLNMSIQQFQKYETCVNKISASLLFEVSRILELPVANFFDGFRENQEYKNKAKESFNILLIEDNINEEFLIREAVAEIPLKVNLYSLQDGYKALDFLKNLHQNSFNKLIKPDIILLELHLPKFNGLEFLKNIKKDRNFYPVPVIIIANSLTNEEALACYNLQVSGVIVKSTSSEKLKEQILTAVSYWAQLVKLPA
jgi:CheY-like chemotaxis protein